MPSSSSIQQLYKELWQLYGPQGWWPLHYTENEPHYHCGLYQLPCSPQGRFEVCLGAILGQNTAWTNVEKALKNLWDAGLFSHQALLVCPEENLSQCIRPAGYFRQKIKKIRLFCQWWEKHDHNQIPTRHQLLSLWGIGEETADSILCYAYHQNVFVADAYSKRLFLARGILNNPKAQYVDVQQAGAQIKPLSGQTQIAAYQEFHALIVHHNKIQRQQKSIKNFE